MSEPPEEYYSEDRWHNWLDRIAEEDIDPEDEDSARLLLNLQDDTALAIAKVVRAHKEGHLDDDEAFEKIEEMRDIVLAEPDIEDEDTALLIDGVQTSLMCVFFAAEEYLAGGKSEEGSVEEYLLAAADAEDNEEMERALTLAAQAGTQLFDEADLDIAITEEFEYGLVTEWVNGLDSLQTALDDPEVVEEA